MSVGLDWLQQSCHDQRMAVGHSSSSDRNTVRQVLPYSMTTWRGHSLLLVQAHLLPWTWTELVQDTKSVIIVWPTE